MDQLYRFKTLDKHSQIKTQYDDDFYPIINLLKRYCKIFKERNLDLGELPRKVSNKILKFKKGEAIGGRASLASIENIEFKMVRPIKSDRTKTFAPKPDFMLEDLEFPPMRSRAKTRF